MTSPKRAAAHRSVDVADTTAWWSTSISDIEPGEIRFHGYPVEQLIGRVSFPEMIWLMLRGELPTAHQAELLEHALVASVDHGPQAPSIASARMAVTCGVGLNNAIASGVNVLGDVHGGAGQACLSLLDSLATPLAIPLATPDRPLADAVASELESLRSRGAYVPGFGHRFHPVDPRRDPLLGAVERAVAAGVVEGRHLTVALEIERQLATGRTRPVPMNIDGATAVIYGELGFEPELSRGLFILSRSVGVLAHAWEERRSGRRIKGPLPPPLLPDYDGPPLRDVPAR